MGTLYVFVIIVTFSTHCSAYVVSNSETYRSIASVLLKEGQSAKISCMTKGTGDYFWRKGNFLYNSTLVASFTVGEVTDDSQPYSVTVNGTLHIRSVTLKDEGNYFCRVSSTENECYGEVKILVQASLLNFDLAIDRCERESSCLLYLDPSQSTSMTCTALNAPPLMTLKWFNGSKEITEGIVQNEIILQNGNSREITSTVAAVYGRPASLTCQAVDPKRSNDDVRFAHAQVEMTVPAHETLQSWIIVSVTLAGCFIVFGIFLLIKAMVNREQRKKYTKVKKEDDESLKKKVNKNEETIKAKHQELTEFKVSAESKAIELSELKGKLRQTEEELKTSRNKNIELQESAKTKNQKIANTDQELTNLRTKLQQRDEEIKKEKNENLELQKKIANIEARLTATKEIAKTKDQELTDLKSKLPDQIQEMSTLKGDLESKAKSIAELEETVEQRDKEINNQREKFLNCQMNLKSGKIALQGKNDDIDKLKSNLKENENEIVNLKKELAKLKGDVQSRPKKITDFETKLRKRDEGIREANNKIYKLQVALLGKERELNLAMQPKGAQEDSQKKPGKKHKGNDGD